MKLDLIDRDLLDDGTINFERLNCQPEDITELTCKRIDITSIPYLPNCKELICKWCELLENISDIPNCTSIEIYLCPLLEKLPDLSNCTYISISFSSMKVLPNMNACINLSIRYCKYIKYLSDLPHCKLLLLDYVPAIKTIPISSYYSEIICHNCYYLTIPNGLRCNKLFLYDNGFYTIPPIYGCEYVEIINEPYLYEIEYSAGLKDILCYNCFHIEKITVDSNFKKIKSLKKYIDSEQFLETNINLDQDFKPMTVNIIDLGEEYKMSGDVYFDYVPYGYNYRPKLPIISHPRLPNEFYPRIDVDNNLNININVYSVESLVIKKLMEKAVKEGRNISYNDKLLPLPAADLISKYLYGKRSKKKIRKGKKRL